MVKQKSMLLNKLATQKKINDQTDQREYRLITGSDDGHIFFWNIPYDLITDAKQAMTMQAEKLKKMSGKGQSYINRKIPEFKPKYELLLSGYA